ncbi:MAG: SMP-30/gluconolactonase/LRE family protein [Bryobacteraceae bacterium]
MAAAALAPLLVFAARNQAAQPYGSIQRLNARLNGIIAPGMKVMRVATGFKWIEGPVWVSAPGYLLFSEISIRSIGKMQPGHGVDIFMHPIKSNGMTIDPQGRLTVAGGSRRDVYRLETMNPHGQITILADKYHGVPLNSPNDLVYSSEGSLYFTDPPYGMPAHAGKRLPFSGVYRLPKADQIKPGNPPDNDALQLLIKNLPRPNGIAFSPDEHYLYVDNSTPKRVWMRYPVKPDGTLGKGVVFYDATSTHKPGSQNPDGMKVDRNGDIFSAGADGLWIFAPDGTHLGTIHLKGTVSNCAWGGVDLKTLYITASPSIYSIHVKVPGIR